MTALVTSVFAAIDVLLNPFTSTRYSLKSRNFSWL